MTAFISWLRSPLLVAPDFPLSKVVAGFNFDVMCYLDDLLFVSRETWARSCQLLALLRYVFEEFGLTLHPAKSHTEP